MSQQSGMRRKLGAGVGVGVELYINAVLGDESQTISLKNITMFLSVYGVTDSAASAISLNLTVCVVTVSSAMTQRLY